MSETASPSMEMFDMDDDSTWPTLGSTHDDGPKQVTLTTQRVAVPTFPLTNLHILNILGGLSPARKPWRTVPILAGLGGQLMAERCNRRHVRSWTS